MPVEPEVRRDYGPSVVRTLTPILVGLILGTLGSDIVGVNEATLTPVVTGLVGAAYYAIVRALEKKWPKMGILLGWAIKPTYQKTSTGE